MPNNVTRSSNPISEQLILMQDEYFVNRVTYNGEENIVVNVKPKQRYFFDGMTTYNESIHGTLTD